jgi:hypothetical protein
MKPCVLTRLVPAAAVLLSACTTTPQPLPSAPSTEAPEAERIAFYERYRPAHVQTETLTGRRPWSPKATLTLHHGDVVAAPTDLLPAIAPGSVSAAAAARSARLDDEAQAWGVAATTTTGIGLVGLVGVLGISIVVLATNGAGVGGLSSNDLVVAGTVLGAGAVVTTAVGLATTTVAEHVAQDAAIERETAFFTYDRALQRRLNLNVNLAASPATTGAP